MCMAALHWARVDTVYYGATIADAKAAGFNELRIPAAEIIRLGGSSREARAGHLDGRVRRPVRRVAHERRRPAGLIEALMVKTGLGEGTVPTIVTRCVTTVPCSADFAIGTVPTVLNR